MRIAVAQIDPVVGAFEANLARIAEAYERACREQARLLLTPELGLMGYPPLDLLDRPEIFERNELALAKAAKLTVGKKCALAVGHVARNPSATGRSAQNVITIFENGKAVHSQAKTLLPTYDVFDEARYFEPAAETHPWICDGKRVGLAICEDLWGNDPSFGRHLYQRDPMDSYRCAKLDILLSCSASPYIWGKRERRESLHGDIARELRVPLVYVNQVGATDEVLFDGASFSVNAQGKVTGRLPAFRNSFGIWENDRWVSPDDREDEAPSEIEVPSRALVMGIRDYFARTGFRLAVLGLSGGIDSAVVATLAAKALGPDKVLGVAMPSQHSSAHSLADAEQLAKNLGVAYEVRPIKFFNAAIVRDLSEQRGELAPLALENLQSRLRGLILMTLSNHHRALVLTTGNKSELAMGYCTLYGDMCGALAPIGDVFKTRVYDLARHINATWGAPIPESSITKPPSAELRPNQTDQDSLPPYEVLDPLLADYLENSVTLDDIRKRHEGKLKKPGWVAEIVRVLELNEFKRRQAAPVLKTSLKAFGIGRRIPIAKTWDQSGLV